MTTRPYELLARFNDLGNVAGVSVRTKTTVNGRDYEDDPMPLAGVSDPAFVQFANQFAAATVAERDQLAIDKSALETLLDSLTAERELLLTEKASLTSERNALLTDKQSLTEQLGERTAERDLLQAQVDPLNAQIEQLQAQIDQLLNPPGPDLSTIAGVKQYLASKRYDREVMGIFVGDQFVSTNRDELAHWFARFWDAFQLLNGLPNGNPTGMYPYKPRGGSEVAVLTSQQVVRAYNCLAWYVNACIATEGELIKAIDNDTPLPNVVALIDADQTWPQRQFTWQPQE